MVIDAREPDLKSAFIDHDHLFKELLTVFFIEFLELFLPELAAEIDRDSVVFLDKELFTDPIDGDKHVVDLIARVRFRNQETYFVVHVENQAKSQARFARRMFHYFGDLDRKLDLPIYPIALFTFERPHRAEPDNYRVTFPDFEPLNFQFRTIQLNRLDWRDFVSQPNPVAAALMARMWIARSDRPRVKLECLRLLATLRLDPGRSRLISGFVATYLRLTASETESFRREVDKLPREEKEKAVPLTISWKEEGRVEGRVEGKLEGQQESLLLIGESWLGAPPLHVVSAIRAITSWDRLVAMGKRLGRVQSWDELMQENAVV